MTQRQPIPAYPLQWPAGWKRTAPARRRPSKYRVPFVKARDDVCHALRCMAARWIVLSSDVPVRGDGLPYARHAEPKDPGVAVYWVDPAGRSRVIACDGWASVRENVRAVGLTLDGIRMIERAGATEILDRSLEGFAALPPAADCWQVLGLDPRGEWTLGPNAARVISDRHRELAREHHPDRGGHAETMARINAARDECLQAIGGAR